ncbi:hypothetical protein Hanom_Chr16g01436631 [Helianthus anomalus]
MKEKLQKERTFFLGIELIYFKKPYTDPFLGIKVNWITQEPLHLPCPSLY